MTTREEKTREEKIPSPKELEKEIGEFLAKKFGGEVKIISPVEFTEELPVEPQGKPRKLEKKINFDLKPEDLVAYLDQYIIKQDQAKAVLATKICTHFNRVKLRENGPAEMPELVGNIKNNILMIGPTGVGKTYMVKLIAKKIGVPFVKGDATKFSETGYVGGDVEDLIRDLVREADDDLELAQYGIVYLDEIDKIASARNLIGADISRTGVQRALLKPMEETEVELKVPNDPISMIQEIERFRRTGRREKHTLNTKNILFIVSGAFADLPEIITKRLTSQAIGFGAQLKDKNQETEILKQVRSEDLIEFGFESEFIGRLPVHAVFERLGRDDLYQILKNPNNPVILSKKLDFFAYGIDIKFEDRSLELLATRAYAERTGARGLVSAVEEALLNYERVLPTTSVKMFPVTEAAIQNPNQWLAFISDADNADQVETIYQQLKDQEFENIREYITSNCKKIEERHNLTLTPARIAIASTYYSNHITDIGGIISKIKTTLDEIKKTELFFYKNHDINIVLEDDAIDFMIDQLVNHGVSIDDFYKQLSQDFEYGLKLVRERVGIRRFFITRDAIISPENYIRNLLKARQSNQIRSGNEL